MPEHKQAEKHIETLNAVIRTIEGVQDSGECQYCYTSLEYATGFIEDAIACLSGARIPVRKDLNESLQKQLDELLTIDSVLRKHLKEG